MSIQPDELYFRGYFPGAIGKITELHAVYYHDNWRFDVSFETQVARELAVFLKEFRQGRDEFITAFVDAGFVGSIAIDGCLARSEGARVRWFIVRPELHGRGIGRALMGKAIKFCRDAGHQRVFLWTFNGLDSARHLYEREGLRLSEEHLVEQWGSTILEQKFELNL
jgi:GNAT superfamily N-acetyltransferase